MDLTVCGLDCDQCPDKIENKCPGCRATEGRPEWGACDVYMCAKEKQLLHCGFCDVFPCANLTEKAPHCVQLLKDLMITQSMVQSRCGLMCQSCSFKESIGCGGCIETKGRPFHGECSIAQCCQNKGFVYCGECSDMPCATLYQYSVLDKEHGDKPAGARLNVLRRWAGMSNKIYP